MAASLRVATLAERELPLFAERLGSLRRRKRFSLRALAHAAEVSTTYIRTLERGYDSRTGKAIRPSVDVIRRVARALGDGAEEEGERIFAELMHAAGYMPGAVREVRAAYGEQLQEPSTIEAIVDSIRRTPELSEEDKEAFIRLIERSRRIVRGEPDPYPNG
jgi:transcriptional regulator with XRE-family HTH domain